MFKLIILIVHLQRNSSKVNTTEPHHWEVKIGVDKDLGLSGNKLLPEPMLTPFMSPYGITRSQLDNAKKPRVIITVMS